MSKNFSGRKAVLAASLALGLSGCGYNTFQTTDEQRSEEHTSELQSR